MKMNSTFWVILLSFVLATVSAQALAEEGIRSSVELKGQNIMQAYSDFPNLRPGFGTRYSSGDSGGRVKARRFNKDCVGWINRIPDHTITVVSPIKMTVTAIALRPFDGKALTDPMMLIKAPDGRVLCDHNSADGLNPKISAEFTPGSYEVFIGAPKKMRRKENFLLDLVLLPIHMSRDLLIGLAEDFTGKRRKRRDTGGRYYLELIEGEDRSAALTQQQLEGSTQGRNGHFRAGAGLMPQPQTAHGITGDPDISWADAAEKFGPTCSGVVHATPDHQIIVTSPVNLNLSVTSQAETSLVVHDGEATTFCTTGNSPLDVQLEPGNYAVYVGHFADAGKYLLTVTENDSNSP